MYVVKVSDFLQMRGVPEPHHVLKQKGLLHEWQPGMFVILAFEVEYSFTVLPRFFLLANLVFFSPFHR